MPEFHLRLFDEFRLTRLPDTEVSLRVKKQSALLAYLTLESRTSHKREQLATMFWPDLDDADARNNLRVVLTRLRRNMKVETDTCIIGTREAVSVDSELFLVDVFEFQRLINSTNQHQHATRASCEQCHQCLIQALDLYRGDLLHGLVLDDCEAFEDWRLHLQQQLRAHANDALEDLAEYLQQSGDYVGSEHYTRWQIRLDPLRETAHRRLMRLLFFMNNRTGSLSHYTALTELLLEELGVGPDTETRSLYSQLESGEFEKPVRIPPIETMPGPPGNLPAEVTRYIGNESVLQLLLENIKRHRLLTVTGLGGVGKTRLAIQLATMSGALFPDGVFFVRLAPLKNDREVAVELASTLNIEADGGTDLVALLHHHLKSRCMLIVLDNFEHIMQARDFVSGLMVASEHLKILVTSQQKLMVSGEASYALQGLRCSNSVDEHISPAAMLFFESASRVRIDFQPTADERAEIETICAMVDGHPLAIELAAGWLETLTCSEIVNELKSGYDILISELADIPDRQRSVDAACRHSWHLLDEPAQHLFASLSVFSGPFDRKAAESIINNASMRSINELVTRSLVRHAPATATYELHELMRKFASNQLATYSWSGKVVAAHSEYYLSILATWEATIDSTTDDSATYDSSTYHSSTYRSSTYHGAKVPPSVDFDNIRSAWNYALESCDLDRLRLSISGLRKLCLINGREYELIGFIEPLIELTNAKPAYKDKYEDFELNLLLALGVAYRNTKGYTDPELAGIFQRARVLSEGLETSAESFVVLYGLWSFNIVRCELDECMEIIQQWQRRLKDYFASTAWGHDHNGIANSQQVQQTTNSSDDLDRVIQDAAFIVHLLEGPVRYLQGKYECACNIMENGLTLDRPDRRAAIVANYGLNFSVSGRFWLSQAQCIAGYPDKGLQTACELEALAVESAQPLAMAFSELGMCLISDLLSQSEGVTKHANRLSDMSFERRIGQYFVHHGKMFEGSTKCLSDPAAGIRIMTQCLNKGIGSRTYFDSDTLLLVRALINDGQLTLASRHIAQALTRSSEYGVKTRLAEIYRLQGEIHAMKSQVEAAIASFTQSLKIASEQKASLFEMRTCLCICKLLPEHEITTLAMSRLQSINNSLAPGVADLQLREYSQMLSLLKS